MIEMVKQNFGQVNFLESQQVAQEVKEVKKELSPSEKLNEIRKDDVNLASQAVEKSKVKSVLDQSSLKNEIQDVMKNITDISSLSPEKLLSLLQEKGIVKKEC